MVGGECDNHYTGNRTNRKSQEPYDFTHMWDIKLKATNDQTRQTNKNSQTQTTVGWLPEGRGIKGVKFVAMEEDLTLGGEHTIEYTDDIFVVLQNYILETYIIL